MQVFGSLISPFARKVALAAAEKGVDWTLIQVGPGDASPEFVAASPFGKIPAIRDGEFSLCDSSAIVAYLDVKHPEPPLIPAEAQARGRTIWLEEFADTMLAESMRKVLFNRFVGPKFFRIEGDEAEAQAGEAELPALFAYLESVAPATGWLTADEFSLADIAVASVLRSLRYVNCEPDPALYPRIAAWRDRVATRDSWRKIAAIEDAPRQKK